MEGVFLEMEKAIEQKLKAAIEELGGKCWKYVSPGTIGAPDRIVLLPGGRIIFVELKDKGKLLRPAQQARIKQMRKLGCDVRVIDSLEQVEAMKSIFQFLLKGELTR